MITIRTIAIAEDGRISHEDYDQLSRWWKIRAKEAPPRNILPTLGVIAERNGQPIASAFAYLDATGSGVAWIGWMITDPAASKVTAGRGMLHALTFLNQECERLNYWLSWATVSDPSFMSFLERRGYTPTDRGLCHFFKPLSPANPSH